MNISLLIRKVNLEFRSNLVVVQKFTFYILFPAICTILLTSCSAGPKYEDDPDLWIYKLKECKPNTIKCIDDILTIHKKSNNNIVKIYTISLLKNHIEIPEVLNTIISELPNDNTQVKIEAIKALGQKGLDMVTNKLIEILYQNIDSQVKIEVCNSLGTIADKRAIPPLIDMLNSKDTFLIFSCSYALHTITGIPMQNGRTIKLPSEWLKLTQNR